MFEIERDMRLLLACKDIDIFTRYGNGSFILYKHKGRAFDSVQLQNRLGDGLRLYINDEDKTNYLQKRQAQLTAKLKKSIKVDIPVARATLHEIVSVALNDPRNVIVEDIKETVTVLVDEYLQNPAIVKQFTYIALHDYSTQLHATNVMLYSIAYMQYQGASLPEIKEFGLAGLFHDVGKLEIPDYLLQAPRRLTDDEFEVIKEHPTYGAVILKDMGLSERIICAAHEHHERIDGSGYPNHKKNEQISEYAKAIAIIDSFEAITTFRPYKEAMDPLKALGLIKKDVVAGKYDVAAFSNFAKSMIGMRLF